MGRVCGAVQNTPRHLVIYHRARVAAPLTVCALVCMRAIERGGDYICMWDAYGVTYGGVVESATFTVTGAFGGYTPLWSYKVQVEVGVQRNFCLCLLVVAAAAAAVANSISIASRKQTKEDWPARFRSGAGPLASLYGWKDKTVIDKSARSETTAALGCRLSVVFFFFFPAAPRCCCLTPPLSPAVATNIRP